MIFDLVDVNRGGQPFNCDEPFYSRPWILNPTNVHPGPHNKLQMFFLYRDCFLDSEYVRSNTAKYTQKWIDKNMSLTTAEDRTGMRLNSEKPEGRMKLLKKVHMFDDAPTVDVFKLKIPDHLREKWNLKE